MAEEQHSKNLKSALDNLTLASKEGWQRFVNTAARIRSIR